MKWQATEMDTYLQAKEYVDTAIITLVPVSWQTEIKQTVAMGEFISIMATELEKQFHGRVIQFPAFSYIKSEESPSRLARLEKWEAELKAGGVKHLVYLTSDSEWKLVENELNGMLIWLPTIPLEHMDVSYKREVISDQMKQLIPLMTNKWQEA
ncbi:YpiF family protein [Halalkalibacter akibai]|uniref:TPR repeat protein n=1 Tax=Halalkalibacter akibai (strain ATCC 43226 / DSM 21942 / CIP 109018 / JCM 9157 / 1139) TaxID=1236973 RepID=W4QRM1_HALA3|nr:YpiF family protein [Halalkalibacter akibai]GAE34572.1 TPR repeat protein [Halalkalibacter akibai JCM 9157]